MRELIVDSFAGGGGASTGIELAIGRSPDIAINHDGVALAMHEANHPHTRHLPHNVWKVDPLDVCGGAPVGLLWASPDCKHFSKAKGGKPVSQNIRDLAWVVVRWAKQVSPRVIVLENVEEFATWGPLGEDERPCPARAGQTFKKFVRELRRLGYEVDWRELVAADYGAPTIRKRLFLIARNDKQPIVWPKATHGRPNSLGVINGRLKPWRTAAEIIDWTLPCPSIFDTSAQIMEKFGVRAIRPLADNTMARIARGVDRYVLNSADPFIVPITHTGDLRVHGMDEPLRTATTAHRGELALVQPFVTKFNTGSTGHDAREPLHGIVTPFFAPRYLEKDGHEPRTRSVNDPAATIVGRGNAPGMLVAPLLVKNNFGDKPHYRADEPTRVIVAGGQHHMLVSAFLAQHNITRGDGINPGRDARAPVSTVMQSGSHQAVVSAGLVSLKGTERRGGSIEGAVPAITAGGFHIAEVRAFIMKYHRDGGQAQSANYPLGTGGTRARFGVITVTIGGEEWALVDIGMRMLTPRELFRAQGFPDTYIIDRTAGGKPISKTDQIRMCGNSVCPDVAKAIIEANYAPATAAEEDVAEFRLQAAE
jgi:DNA (cytosine-5)-methyltransferase 1